MHIRHVSSSRTARRVLASAGIVGLALGAAACGSGDSGSGGSGGKDDIGVALITKDSSNPFFVAMQKGAKADAAKNGVKLTVASGKEEGDDAGQIAAIEQAVVRGDKGILITPMSTGVNDAIKKARDAGLYVIALDTPPDPANTVDITFATNNREAGNLIGKWAASTLDGKAATIALLDLFNDKIVSVDYDRDQGFLEGMGIDVADPKKNGDEAKTGKYTGGKGGDYTIVCNEPTQGAADGGKTAMETCLAKSKDINLVYSINEPSGGGGADALKAAGVKATIVSVDGGCDPGLKLVKDGTIGATSQQYPVKMAQLGVEAIAKFKKTGEKPQVTPGLDFYDTGVALVTDKPVDGLKSITVAEGEKLCWGK
jgi:fructose transport system substrate-binding protein